MKYKIKAKIIITDDKGHTATFDESSVVHIELETPRREGVLEFKLKPNRRKK